MGKGGTGVFKVDGKTVDTVKMPGSIPAILTIDESPDVGMDTRTPLNDDYKLPFKFTGQLGKVHFKLGPSQMAPADEAKKVAMIRTMNN